MDQSGSGIKEQYKCAISSKQASFVDSVFTVFSQGYLANSIEKLDSVAARKLSVAEIGCYNARLMNFLIQRKVEVFYTGVDARQEYLNESELKDHKDVVLLVADVTESLPIDNESQDIIVCSEVIEHLDEEDLPEAIENMTNALKYGGTLITSFPTNLKFHEYHSVKNERDLGHVNFPLHHDYIDLVEKYDMMHINFDSGFTIRSSYNIPNEIRLSPEFKRIRRMLGDRVALAYSMTIDHGHTGGGYYTFIKGTT